MKKRDSISVVIPSYNSKRTIVRCLNSVLNQSYKKPYEIIVVDSSDDGTDEIIKHNFPSVKLIHLEKKTLPGPARNIGARSTNSDYIALTDADCVVNHDWIEKILQRMQNGQCDVVGGIISNGTPDCISGTLGYLNEFSFYVMGSKPGFVTCLATANACYKRRVFEKHQFMDSIFPGDDTTFHWSILDSGGKLFFDPEMKITHLNRKGFLNALKHQYRVGEGAGIARVVMKRDLILVRHPFLCLTILPFVRLFKMYIRIFKANNNLFWKTFFFLPLSLIISFGWSFGFFSKVKGLKD